MKAVLWYISELSSKSPDTENELRLNEQQSHEGYTVSLRRISPTFTPNASLKYYSHLFNLQHK